MMLLDAQALALVGIGGIGAFWLWKVAVAAYLARRQGSVPA